MSRGRCRNCGADIIWVPKSPSGWHRPVEIVESSGYLVFDDGRLREATGLLRVHLCDPATIEQYTAIREAKDEQTRLYEQRVTAIDCPHPRCNGVAGGPCKSLVDGVTDLRSFHPERAREATR